MLQRISVMPRRRYIHFSHLLNKNRTQEIRKEETDQRRIPEVELEPLDEGKLIKTRRKLKSGTRLWQIFRWIVKEMGISAIPSNAQSSCRIINNEKIPKAWKKTAMCPIYKRGDHACNNCRCNFILPCSMGYT